MVAEVPPQRGSTGVSKHQQPTLLDGPLAARPVSGEGRRLRRPEKERSDASHRWPAQRAGHGGNSRIQARVYPGYRVLYRYPRYPGTQGTCTSPGTLGTLCASIPASPDVSGAPPSAEHRWRPSGLSPARPGRLAGRQAAGMAGRPAGSASWQPAGRTGRTVIQGVIGYIQGTLSGCQPAGRQPARLAG